MAVLRSPLTSGTSSGGTTRTGSYYATTSSTSTSTTTSSSGEELQRIEAPAEGIAEFSFYATPGISANGTPMTVAGVAVAVPTVALFRGSIVGITYSADAAMTAGTCTFTLRINGTATGAILAWTTSTTRGSAAFPKGDYGFVRDDYFDVTFTTNGSYSPTSSKVLVTLYAYADQQEAS
jgi:hypothetical protein